MQGLSTGASGALLEDLALHSIADAQARELVRRRRNLRAAQADIQRRHNEINRLKGEQGHPTRKPTTPQPPPKDRSSAQERRTPKAWSKGRKTDRIPTDRAQVVAVDPARVPLDAVCKGSAEVVVQDGLFRTDNVLCRKETFSSPSQHTTSVASLPPGSRGQCGPGAQEPGAGVLLWGADERAEGGGAVAECGDTDL